MKKEEMLRAVGEIDEKYVVEAEEAVGATGGEAYEEAAGYEYKPIYAKSGAGESARAKRKRRGLWAASLAAVLVVGLCIGSFLDGAEFIRMGSSGDMASEDSYVMTDDYDLGDYELGDYDYSAGEKSASSLDIIAALPESEMAGDSGSAPMGAENSVAYDAASDVKLIYRADVRLQTTEFDDSVEAIRALVDSVGGYFESSEISNGSYFSDSNYKSGYYTIRVPQAKYREFLDSLQGDNYVVYMNESVEDIGLEYFETEGRLETLRIKQQRLQDLMKDAHDMSDIIDLENALSDTEYQIEMYSSTLNRYDSLVGYSTITVTLEKVSRYDDSIDRDESFFARLGESLRDGAQSFLDALDCLANWIVYNLITLIIIVVIVVIAIKFHWIRSIRGWWKERRVGRIEKK